MISARACWSVCVLKAGGCRGPHRHCRPQTFARRGAAERSSWRGSKTEWGTTKGWRWTSTQGCLTPQGWVQMWGPVSSLCSAGSQSSGFGWCLKSSSWFAPWSGCDLCCTKRNSPLSELRGRHAVLIPCHQKKGKGYEVLHWVTAVFL